MTQNNLGAALKTLGERESGTVRLHEAVTAYRDRFPERAWRFARRNRTLVAALSVDALGPARVHCVMLPYRYASNESLSDAADCAKALGVRYDIVPIAPAVEGFLAMLEKMFAGRAPDVTEQIHAD